MHPLLERQLRRIGIQANDTDEEWQKLLERVSRTYDAADHDRYLLERSLEISSKEMQELYAELAARSETELAAERDKLDSVMLAVSEGICALSANGDILFLNEAAKRLLGGATRESVSRVKLGNENIFQLAKRVSSDSIAELANLDAALEGDDQVSLEVAARPMPNDQGCVITFRDVTARRQDEQYLNEALVAAQQAATARRDFLAMMSHEIRTPMNGIIGVVGLLMETQLTAEQLNFSRTIANSGRDLLAVINDILDFSKFESGKMELEELAFDLLECVSQAADLLAQRAHAKQISFVVNIDPKVPRIVSGDATRLRQVLVNLLGNAVKFTSPFNEHTSAGGRIELNVSRGELDGNSSVRFEVRDNGLGIPEDRQQRLFLPFSQADSSTTRKFGGTGLGLAICKQIADRMNGQVGLSSVAKEGSTFWFEIPLVAEEPEEESSGRFSMIPTAPAACHVCALGLSNDDYHSLKLLCHRWGISLTPNITERSSVAVVFCQQAPNRSAVMAQAVEKLTAKDIPWIALQRFGESDMPEWSDSAIGVLATPLRYDSMVSVLLRASGEAKGAEAAVSRTAPIASASEYRVLVVEDHAVNQMVAKQMLTYLGFKCDIVGNGAECLQILAKKDYDLILMDVQMPEMDGYEATQRLRAKNVQTPIIAMTANAMREDIEMCLSVGMTSHIAKPITIGGLRETLVSVVEKNLRKLT